MIKNWQWIENIVGGHNLEEFLNLAYYEYRQVYEKQSSSSAKHALDELMVKILVMADNEY